MKNINIALVGGGFMGKSHSGAYRLLPILFPDIVAQPVCKVVCEINEELAKTSAKNLQWEEYAVGWEKVVSRPDIDMVDIATPPYLHDEVAIAAAEAGKMVFCEKPLAQNAEVAQRMYDAVKKAGVPNAVAFNKRRWPAIAFAKKLFDDDVIGKPLFFIGNYHQPVYLNPVVPFSWRSEKEKGSGFNESTCHIIDLCRFFLGEVDEVVGVTDIKIKERPTRLVMPGEDLSKVPKKKCSAEDIMMFIAKLRSGIFASLVYSGVSSGYGDGIKFEILGTKGGIRWNGDHPNDLDISLESDPREMHGYKTVGMGAFAGHPYPTALPPFPGLGFGMADNMACEISDMLSSFANGKSFSPDFYDGLQAAKIGASIEEAAKTKRWVKVSK